MKRGNKVSHPKTMCNGYVYPYTYKYACVFHFLWTNFYPHLFHLVPLFLFSQFSLILFHLFISIQWDFSPFHYSLTKPSMVKYRWFSVVLKSSGSKEWTNTEDLNAHFDLMLKSASEPFVQLSSLWWCNTIHSLLAKGSSVQMIWNTQSFLEKLNPTCDLEERDTNLLYVIPAFNNVPSHSLEAKSSIFHEICSKQ